MALDETAASTRRPRAMRDSTRRRRVAGWSVRVAPAIVLLLVAYLLAVPLLSWRGVTRVDADPGGTRPPDQPGTTYLLAGTDSRADLTASERRRLHTGRGGGDRADSIMLLHTGRGPNLLLSIPRASLLDVPGHGRSMVNAAYQYGGPELLVQSIEQATGIRVDGFVQVGFGDVVRLVDTVGGVTICPTVRMDDRRAGLHVRRGCQEADGRRALAYARSRHAQRLDDLDRAAHQREIVAAAGAEVLSWRTLLDPVRYWNVMRGGAASVTVDDRMGPLAFARLASALRHVDQPAGLTCGVPITDASVQSVHWDTARSQRLFALIREDRTDEVDATLCQPSGLAR